MPQINGKQGYVILSADFVQPALNATVSAIFSVNGWIPTAGNVIAGHSGVYRIESSFSNGNAVIRLLEQRNAIPGDTVLAGSTFGAAGEKGHVGSQGPTGLVFNTETVLSTPASSTSTLESTLVSATFTAPASGMAMLFAMGTLSYAQNNGELEVYLDVSGVAGARVPNMIRGSAAVPREAFSPMLRVSGLTPGNSYTARVRWRSVTTGTPRVCNPTTDTKQAARLTILNIA